MSKCVNWAKKISGYDPNIGFHVEFDIFGFRHSPIKHLRKKRHTLNMFPTKCQGQNYRMGRPEV